MKKQFDITDLKDEYLRFFEYYKSIYDEKHPYSYEKLANQYAINQIRNRARKLYDYTNVMDAINNDFSLDEILTLHKSCVERMPFDTYYKCLDDFFVNAECILDVGCGLNPCIILKNYRNIIKYIGIDNDTRILKILNLLNKKHLNRDVVLFSNPNWNEELNSMNLFPDIVLIQKIISNFYYGRNIVMTDKIAQIKANCFFVSGCKMSLSRNVSIMEDEIPAIEWFISRYGFKKIKYLETPSEFGWILSR